MSSRIAGENFRPDRQSLAEFCVWRGKVEAHWQVSDARNIRSSTTILFRLRQSKVIKFDGLDVMSMPIECGDDMIAVVKADRSKYAKAYCVYNGSSESVYTTGRIYQIMTIVISAIFCFLMLDAFRQVKIPGFVFSIIAVPAVPGIVAVHGLIKIYIAQWIMKRELAASNVQFIRG